MSDLHSRRDPVEFHDGSVLPVPDHGGLDHFPEGRLLGGGDQERTEGVDVTPTPGLGAYQRTLGEISLLIRLQAFFSAQMHLNPLK